MGFGSRVSETTDAGWVKEIHLAMAILGGGEGVVWMDLGGEEEEEEARRDVDGWEDGSAERPVRKWK